MTSTYTSVEREIGNESAVIFSWPTAEASFQLTRSIDGGPYDPASGVVTFRELANGILFYEISFHVDDRPVEPGLVVYSLNDGAITRLLPVRIVEAASTDCEIEEPAAPLLTPDGIGEAMAAPARMTVEGNTVEQHSLADQIAADKYRRSLIAAEQPTSKRIRIGRFTPPGTT